VLYNNLICIIHKFFQEKFGFKFTQYRQWGFTRASHMFSKLPEMCCICIVKNDTKIISIKKNHICDVHSMIDSKKKEIGKVFFNLYTEKINFVNSQWTKENSCNLYLK